MRQLLIWYGNLNYLPSVKFYIDDVVDPLVVASDLGEAIAGALANTWQVEAFEVRPMTGPGPGQTSFSDPYGGIWGGKLLPVQYCAFVRLEAAAEIERPSSKYLHGITTDMMTAVGFPDGDYLAAWSNIMEVMDEHNVLNSNGQPISNYDFRAFSKRRKVARRPL